MPIRIFLFTLLAFSLAACAVPTQSPTFDQSPTPSATALPTSTPAPTPTPVPKPDIGVQGQFIGPDGDSGIKSAANLGVGWIKQQVDWNSVEYARGLYHWEELDHLVAEAQKRGLKIMLSVARAPGFSRPEPVEEDGPPSDFTLFHDFI